MNSTLSASHYAAQVVRRASLGERIQERYPEYENGLVLVLGGFEHEQERFLQESTFYYFTGIQEPGVVLLMNLDAVATLYAPAYAGNRAQWVVCPVPLTQEHADLLGVRQVQPLGKPTRGYQLHPFSDASAYTHLIADLVEAVRAERKIFTLAPCDENSYVEQRVLLGRLIQWVPGLDERLVDISPLVAQLRRAKDHDELENIHAALDITALAHEAAGAAIKDGVNESEVQAALEYMVTASSARMAFPTIVASGRNGTVLHYHENNRTMLDGDLVVIDSGARVNGYCSDITRTYPVSGKFTPRQKELYTLVLEVQEYVAGLARPGMWLSHKEHPEQSLNHLAKKYLTERGYGDYFPHGIGHFLGLDVHDVGDSTEPLAAGDVITIEPGIYIPQEGIGIRIEDNYWVVEDGAVCLSDMLCKKIADIEELMRSLHQ